MDTTTESRLDFVVRKLREAMPKNWPEISDVSGVPPKTISKIAYRETRDPRGSTVDKLFDYFSDLDTGVVRKDQKPRSNRTHPTEQQERETEPIGARLPPKEVA